MSFRSKRPDRPRRTSKVDTMLPPPDFEQLQGICINDATRASTSNEGIPLSERMDRRQDEAVDVQHPNVKNNNKCGNTSILDTHDENCLRKGTRLLRTQSNLKNFVGKGINDQRSGCIGRQINIGRENLDSRNEVPESGNSIALRSAASSETDLISKCLNEMRKTFLESTPKTSSQSVPQRRKLLSSVKSNKPGTSSVEVRDTDVLAISRDSGNTSIVHNLCGEDDVHLINNKNVPDKNERDFQEGKINDRISSNSFQLTHDVNLKEKGGTEEVENRITAPPAKPTRSLPRIISIEDNYEKKILIKDKNKLPSSAQSFTESMQLTTANNDPKSIGEYVGLLIKQQISSDEDTSMRKTVSEVINENNENEAIHQDVTSEINVENGEQNPLPVMPIVKKRGRPKGSFKNISEVINENDENEAIGEQNPLPVMPIVKRKRGRPKGSSKKVINDSTDQSTLNKSKDCDTSQEILDIVAEPVARNTRRASKIKITGLSDESEEDTPLAVRKRGRPPGSGGSGRGRGRGRGRGKSRNSLDTEYIPRSTGSTANDPESTKESNKIDDTGAATDSNAPNIEQAVQLVTCAKCNKEMPKKQWSPHNLNQHNNMAWRTDEEPLDFENDEKLLKRILAAALKKKKSKFLACEQCDAAKRSVYGFISHMQFCGKSEKEREALMVTCPICEAVMMPSSVEVHERFHRQQEQSKIKEANLIMEKTKRKAAERAVPKILEHNKILQFLKEKNLNMDDVIIQTPEKKKELSAWKVMWQEELDSNGIAFCKQIGCTFKCYSYKTMCEHYSQCDFAPKENLTCGICKFAANSRSEIVNHIEEAHSSYGDADECSDYETDESEPSDETADESMSEYSVKLKLRHSSKKNSDSTKTCSKTALLEVPESIYKQALCWTLDFELDNYELALFKDDVPNCFTLLSDSDAATYLPEQTASMAFKRVSVNKSSENTESSDDDWKRMNRFEGDACKDVSTFFVGGPVWALAWLPIPSPMYSKNPTQYIAISTHPTMESQYAVGRKYSGPNVIQIWDVGPLNHEVNSENRSPVLAYAIAHNNGTVWCLEWCPSGCYQDVDLGNYKMGENKLRRMGLLAAACSDGCINIYSLPFADELKFEKSEYNSLPIYKTEPIMTLVVNILTYDAGKQYWQCTKLSWTKGHGHDIIAAGFTNGYIGLWHLTTTSPFLLTERKNTKFIDAFKHFFAHHNAITMVALVPHDKNRYLASASVDKSYKFWDLEETGTPQNCIKRGIVVNGVWMTNWPCAVLSFDDAIGYHYMHTLVVPVREYGHKFCPILATNSPTYGLAVSDHANGIAHGTLAGEVMTIFLQHMLSPDKMFTKKRQLNSFIETVNLVEEQQHSDESEDEMSSEEYYCMSETYDDKESKDETSSKEYHYMPETYDKCKDRFGIIFHDNLTNLRKNVARGKLKNSLNNDKLRSFPIEQFPFTSVNRMTWNPNGWSYLWLATGYQNGLVRLLNVSSMTTTRELKNRLPEHVTSMLSKREQLD